MSGPPPAALVKSADDALRCVTNRLLQHGSTQCHDSCPSEGQPARSVAAAFLASAVSRAGGSRVRLISPGRGPIRARRLRAIL